MSLSYDIRMDGLFADMPLSAVAEAEGVLLQLAEVFFQQGSSTNAYPAEIKGPNIEERYRALVEQIPAIVFMAYLDRGIGEAYVSQQIEATLGFTQREWLEDPVRWYQQIHPKDKDRWSVEAARVFFTGEPLRSAYRVLARDGRVVWFHCEAKLIRRDDGRPWFIHGVAFDITDLKKTEEALQEERNVVSAILDTVGALVVVMDTLGQIVRFNRACDGLEDGEVPLCLMFSGTVFYADESGALQVAPISWDKETRFRLPVGVWKEMMDLYYPNTAWLNLRRDVFDRLQQYKMSHAIPGWEQTLERLLDLTEPRVSTSGPESRAVAS